MILDDRGQHGCNMLSLKDRKTPQMAMAGQAWYFLEKRHTWLVHLSSCLPPLVAPPVVLRRASVAAAVTAIVSMESIR